METVLVLEAADVLPGRLPWSTEHPNSAAADRTWSSIRPAAASLSLSTRETPGRASRPTP